MPVQQVSKKQVAYTPVKFHDAVNKQEVVYDIPIGAKIGTTDKQYEVRKDGVYYKNKKVNELDIPLPDMVALKNFDVNGDKKIDKEDIKAFELKGKNASMANNINEDLAKKGSKYYVVSGSEYENAGVSKEYGFGVTFSNSKNAKKGKYFGITFK